MVALLLATMTARSADEKSGTEPAKAPAGAKKSSKKSEPAKPAEKGASSGGKLVPMDLAFGVPVGRPLLCTRTVRLKGELILRGKAAGQKVPMSSQEVLTFIDEHEVMSATDEEGTRTFLKATASMNGDVDDPPYAGLVAAFSRKEKNVNLQLKGNRALSQKRLNDLIRLAPSLGIWLELPHPAKPGVANDVDLMPLTPAMVSGELPVESAAAKLTLESIDESTGTATLRGAAKIVEAGEVEGRKISSTYQVSCLLKVRPSEQRIVSLNLDGTFQSEVNGEFEGSLKGTFTSELVTEIGEAVIKARETKAVYRPRPWTIGQLGVRLTLPSSWDRQPFEKNLQNFLSTLNADKGQGVITIQLIADDASNAKAYFDSFTGELRKRYPSLQTSKVSGALGAGQAYTYSEQVDGKEFKMRLEAYPHRKQLVFYKLTAEPKKFALLLPEFEKARATLKPLR